ncbi:MAG: cysteine hydrolase family protein [Chloroflexia bacterium]
MRYDSSKSVVVLSESTALVVIDVQKGLDEPYWGERNNPEAEQNMARLLDAWRRRGMPIYYIQHQSKNPNSPLRPNYVGNEIKDIVRPRAGEPVLQKNENSAFIGTDLEERLRAGNQNTVVLTGLTTDHCVSSTARMAANLGFDTIVVSDATATNERYSPITSRHFTAEEMHEAELTSLSGEFARIAETETVLRALGSE